MKFAIKVTTDACFYEKLCDSMNDALRWLTRFDPKIVVRVQIDRQEA